MIRYSNLEPNHYGARGFVLDSVEAWNLAFLSHDYREGPPKDPQFGIYVKHTLQFDRSTHRVDLSNLLDDRLTVRPWLRQPAPYFVRCVVELHAGSLMALPLYAAYGQRWLATLQERERLYCEPFNIVHDYPVSDFSLASAALQRHIKR
jgi:hypothetical protein